MSDEPFSFEDAQSTLTSLIKNIQSKLTEEDKNFLLDFVRLQNDFNIGDYKQLEKLPGIQWKLKNLKLLSVQNPEKFKEQFTQLQILFNTYV